MARTPRTADLDDSRLHPAIEAAENRPFRDLYAYWRSKCAGPRFPARRAIDPIDIPQLLSQLFLLDVVPNPAAPHRPRIRFRLVGTRIAALEGEHRGLYLDEIMTPERMEKIAPQYFDACRGVVYLRDSTLVWQDRPHVDYTVLLLPLAEDGAEADALLGYVLYRNA